MPVVHEDIVLTISINEPIPFGRSFGQQLNDGIIFTLRSSYARMIQFKCRKYTWTAGPDDGEECIIDFNNTADKLDYQVDSASRTDPYYGSGGGAQVRRGGITTIADQPDVNVQSNLYFEPGKKLEEMHSYPIINEFRALSFIILHNKVIRTIQWYRTGSNGHARYHDIVVTQALKTIPMPFMEIIRDTGYNAPMLARG